MELTTPSSQSIPPALYDTSASSGSGSASLSGTSGSFSGRSRRKIPQHQTSSYYSQQHQPHQSSHYTNNNATMNEGYTTNVPSSPSGNKGMYQQHRRMEQSSQHYRNDYSRAQHATLHRSSPKGASRTSYSRNGTFSPVAQSEPNFSSSDEARFSAYVNRFATYDRSGTGSSSRQQQPQRHYVPTQQQQQQQQQEVGGVGSYRSNTLGRKLRYDNSATYSLSPESVKTARSVPTIARQRNSHGYYNHHHPPDPPEHRIYRTTGSEPGVSGWQHEHEFEHENPHHSDTMMHLPLDLQHHEGQPYFHGVEGGSPNSIETPPRRSVTELKRRLWDGEEALQVSVRPSLHGHGDSHPQDWSHYQGPELAGGEGLRASRSLSPGRRQYRNHQSWADHDDRHIVPNIHRDSDVFVQNDATIPLPSPTRSSSTGVSQYRKDIEGDLQGEQRRQESNNPNHYHHNENPPAFKSRFYQAAMAAQRVGDYQQHDQFVEGKSNSEGSHRRSLLQTPGHDNIHPPYSNRSEEALPPEQGDVASLVAKLSAAQMSGEDPGKALEKINAILRAESNSTVSHGISARGGRQHEFEEQEQEQQEQHRTISDDSDESSGDDSEDTSVSSITNPSYATGKPPIESIQDTVPPKHLSMSNFRRPRPSGLEAYNNNNRGTPTAKANNEGHPPPSSINVNDGSPKKVSQQLNKLDAHINSASNQQYNAAAIALKIQKWDEMSDSDYGRNQDKSPSAPSGQSPFKPRQRGGAVQMLSPNSSFNESTPGTVNTEDLGSIMTPLDEKEYVSEEEDDYVSETLKPVTRMELAQRRSHPWDSKAKGNGRRNGSVGLDSVGVESNSVLEISEGGSIFESSFGGTSGTPDKSILDAEQQHANNMSQEFDDAWVDLPSSTFFPAKKKANFEQKTAPRSYNLVDDDYGPKRSKSRAQRNVDALNTTSSSITSDIMEAFSGKDDLLNDVPAATTATTTPDNSFDNVNVSFYDSPATKIPPDEGVAAKRQSSETKRRKGGGLFGNRNSTMGGTPLLCGSRPDDNDERSFRKSARSASTSKSPGRRRRSLSKSKSPGRRWFGSKKSTMGHI